MINFYTDTHAHIHMPPLNIKTDEIVENAKNKGIKRIITIGIDLNDSRNALLTSNKYTNVYCSIGVHPHNADGFHINQIQEFEKLADDKKVVAIGEIGLDFYRNHSTYETQKDVFKNMIHLAIDKNLPFLIHSREASKETVEILDSTLETLDHPLVFHCFNGDNTLIEWGLKRKNVYFSFAGNLTYKKAIDLHAAAKTLPLDRLLIETDCPYLAPVPKRGKENEPANIVYTADFLSDLKDINLNILLNKLENNLLRVFKKISSIP